MPPLRPRVGLIAAAAMLSLCGPPPPERPPLPPFPRLRRLRCNVCGLGEDIPGPGDRVDGVLTWECGSYTKESEPAYIDQTPECQQEQRDLHYRQIDHIWAPRRMTVEATRRGAARIKPSPRADRTKNSRSFWAACATGRTGGKPRPQQGKPCV